MTSASEARCVAVVCDRRDLDARHLARSAVAEAAGDHPDVRRFSSRELHRLYRQLRRGAVRDVVFPSLPDLLEVVWEDEMDLDRLREAGIRLHFVEPLPDDPAGLVRLILESWQRWNRRRRKRRAVAGVVLSAVVLAAVFVLLAVLG